MQPISYVATILALVRVVLVTVIFYGVKVTHKVSSKVVGASIYCGIRSRTKRLANELVGIGVWVSNSFQVSNDTGRTNSFHQHVREYALSSRMKRQLVNELWSGA